MAIIFKESQNVIIKNTRTFIIYGFIKNSKYFLKSENISINKNQ